MAAAHTRALTEVHPTKQPAASPHGSLTPAEVPLIGAEILFRQAEPPHCLNQHHRLANRMREEGIRFQQCANAFLKCAAPKRLRELSDSLTAQDLVSCGQKWLARLTPFLTRREREQAGCGHRLVFSQVECCDKLIFRRRAALDNLGDRLLDANRTIGRPDKITTIFGRRSPSPIRANYKPRSKTCTYR
jgi:hypothetical protein